LRKLLRSQVEPCGEREPDAWLAGLLRHAELPRAAEPLWIPRRALDPLWLGQPKVGDQIVCVLIDAGITRTVLLAFFDDLLPERLASKVPQISLHRLIRFCVDEVGSRA